MKHSSIISITLLMGVSAILSACSTTNTPPLSTPTVNELSSGQIASLQYLTQEELLAEEVYTFLYDKRGTKQFGNILQSEDKHHQRMQDILSNYQLPDLSNDDHIGKFADQEIQTLYDTLIVQGSTSKAEALAVGRIIEQQDIADIQKLYPLFVDYPDITSTLQKLESGSQRHLAAFSK